MNNEFVPPTGFNGPYKTPPDSYARELWQKTEDVEGVSVTTSLYVYDGMTLSGYGEDSHQSDPHVEIRSYFESDDDPHRFMTWGLGEDDLDEKLEQHESAVVPLVKAYRRDCASV